MVFFCLAVAGLILIAGVLGLVRGRAEWAWIPNRRTAGAVAGAGSAALVAFGLLASRGVGVGDGNDLDLPASQAVLPAPTLPSPSTPASPLSVRSATSAEPGSTLPADTDADRDPEADRAAHRPAPSDDRGGPRQSRPPAWDTWPPWASPAAAGRRGRCR